MYREGFHRLQNYLGINDNKEKEWSSTLSDLQCGKFAVLDRMLVKLHASGHRVLLFSTMTKLLDLLVQTLFLCDLKLQLETLSVATAVTL